jgi:2'-hydroxyisoflavone reductase
MKKILVLGGTMFVGRALVEKLRLMPESEITLFNRGKSNADLFADVNQLHGNRETDDILQVCNQHWDCVIDFSGYYPVTFEKLLNDLKGKVGRYIFISTISVYDLEKFADRPITEADEILGCTETQKASKLPDAYGEKKAEMERILLAQDWLDKIILRPSFIYGKYDWTERFYYWLFRAKFSAQVLMPEDYSLSLTYADDLAAGILNAIEVKAHNTIYNTISQSNVSLRQVVNTAAAQFNRTVDFIDAPESLLDKNDLHNSVFPLFVPLNLNIEGTNWLRDFSVTQVDFNATIETTSQYHDSIGWSNPKAGLSIEKETKVIRI